jgi:hypothetical protein
MIEFNTNLYLVILRGCWENIGLARQFEAETSYPATQAISPKPLGIHPKPLARQPKAQAI